MTRKVIPQDPTERIKWLDKRLDEVSAHVERDLHAKKIYANGSDGAIIDSTHVLSRQLSNIERSHRRFRNSLVGAVAVLALGIAYVNKDSIVDNLQQKPKKLTVDSQVPLIDAQGNEIKYALSYELSTQTHTRQLVNSAGKALLIDVSLHTSDSYLLSTLASLPQVCVPESPDAMSKGCSPMTPQSPCVAEGASKNDIYCLPKNQLSSDALFIKMKGLAQTDNAWVCTSEVSNLVNIVKTHPDIFANNAFSKDEIASATTQHDIAYQPFSEIPRPAVANEIIFVSGDIELSC